MSRKLIPAILIILTAANLLIFLNREHFRYQSFATPARLYNTCDESCTHKWKQFADDYPAGELEEARHISDSIVNHSTTTFNKILGIGLFLHQNFSHRLGQPDNNLLSASPLTQFKRLQTEDSLQLWCGNLSAMFSYFAWSQGIICRNIEILNPGNHHVLNECYLPETSQWIVVDLTNNIMAAESGGNLLHFVGMREQTRNSTEVMAWRRSGDSLVKESLNTQQPFLQTFYDPSRTAFYYHWINYSKVYKWSFKAKEYFLPVSWYDILRREKGSNVLFYVKIGAIVLWIASFFVFLAGRKKSGS